MKKIHHTMSLIMVLLFLGRANAFVEKRHQWWEVRLKNLTAEKTQLLKKDTMDGQVMGIIENEMNRARDIIAVFESEMRDDGSLNHDMRTMSGADIDAEARTTVPPLFALHQLDNLVSAPGNGAATAAVRSVAEKRLNSMVQSSFGEKSPDLVRWIMDTDITKDEWKSLASEYLIGSMMATRKTMEERVIADIAARLSLALKEKNNIANSRELRLMTVRIANEYIGECRGHEYAGNGLSLESSWTWRRIEAGLSRDFGACKKIIAMMKNFPGTRDGISLERAMFYHRHPADLESLLFKGQRPPQASRPAATGMDRHQPDAIIMEIPAPVNADAIMDDIDRVRHGAAGTITGREDEKYLDDLDKKLAAAISRHSTAVKKRFSLEEERVRLLRKKDGVGLAIANEKDFLEAKNNFHAFISLVDDYEKKSWAFVSLVIDGKRMNSRAIVEQYRYRLQRNEEYVRFAAVLTTECLRLSSVEDSRVQKQYAVSMSKIGSFFNFIAAGLTLGRNDKTHLTRRDMGTIRELRTVFTGTMNALRADISNSRVKYDVKQSSSAGAARKRRESLKETIAQDEVDGLFQHAVECVELFEQYRYGEKSLYRYADIYKTFLKEARTGAPSEALGNSLKTNSLLVSLDQFDSSRISRELATKNYLQKEARTSLARLATLLEFYKKNNVAFKDAPQPKEMASLEKRISMSPMIKIESWKMNESNYQEIDKKAARKLALILYRKDLVSATGNAPKDKAGPPLMTISLKEPELSLTLPRGWEEESVGETETYLGIVKSFHSGDGNSSVRLVKLALDRGDMKEAAEGWIEKSGSSLVEKKWSKTGDVEYLWILSRDSHNNVFETCSISKDGYAVLINGRTSRNSYAVFRIQFRKIINSLQMETL